ncbi:hypothetical protein SLS55_002073 [Diplodia seriata]|uniref:BTB domain-containing protein n=1 Tax=Diplodia seriata TaxID=420778 RepID=A0ABR3CR49_9PEZI
MSIPEESVQGKADFNSITSTTQRVPLTLKSAQESTTGIIHMDDEPAQLIESFLQFFYTGNYKPHFTLSSCSSPDDSASKLINFHIAMYQLAEKYTVGALQPVAARHFAAALDELDLYTPSRFDAHAIDLLHAVYTSTLRNHGPHLREHVTTAVFQTNPLRRCFVQSRAFVALADAYPEIWKDFLTGVLGLVHISADADFVGYYNVDDYEGEGTASPPWSLRGPRLAPFALVDVDSLWRTCEDLPEDRRAWTRAVLMLRSERKEDCLGHRLNKAVLTWRMNELRRSARPAAYWKRWVRALMGVQCDPKAYRCEGGGGCGDVFEWALPTKAARDDLWPCRACWKMKKTIDEWEDCVVFGDGEGEGEGMVVDD